MTRLAVVALLLLAAPAAASPHVAVSGDGTAQVAWTELRGAHARVVVDGRTIEPRADWLTGPVAFGRRRFALAYTDERQRRLYARISGRRRGVATGRRLVRPQIAGNARGRLALAWFDDRGTTGDAVFVALRRRGGSFGRPLRLARGSVRSVSVAVGPRGDVLVAWNAHGKVRGRFRGRGSRGFGPVQTIRSREAFGARLATEVVRSGRAIVGWTAKFRSEGGDARDTFVQVAARPARARRFGRARLLARHGGDQGALRLDGRHVAWSTPDGAYVDGERVAPAGALLQDFVGTTAVWLQDGRVHAGGEPISGPGASDADADGHPLAVVWLQDGRVVRWRG